MPPLQLDKEQIIRLAACHTCCARRGEPCIFSRSDDPRNLRAAARQSHLDRIERARKKITTALDPAELVL
jgi:sulfur relay (sulfurtransferase) complex TusBCD TusD component (DsrE family)